MHEQLRSAQKVLVTCHAPRVEILALCVCGVVLSMKEKVLESLAKHEASVGLCSRALPFQGVSKSLASNLSSLLRNCSAVLSRYLHLQVCLSKLLGAT